MKKVLLLLLCSIISLTLKPQVKVISNGNVGIGVSSPSEKLSLSGNLRLEGANPFVYFSSGNVTFRNLTSGNQIIFQTGTTTRFAIVGSSYLSSNLTHRFIDGSASTPSITGSGTGKTSTGILWPTTNTIAISTGGTERMRIDENGNVGIGTTTLYNGEKLRINGSWGSALSIYVNHSSDGVSSMKTYVNRAYSANYTLLLNNDVTFYVQGDGLVCSATGFYNWSDENLKTNLAPIEEPISKILSLKGYYYDFNPEILSLQHCGRQIGLLAQDVEAIVPEVVGTTMDGKKALDYSKLVVLLIEAFKEQNVRFEELEEMVIIHDQNLHRCCPEYIFEKSFNNVDDEDNSIPKNIEGSYLLQNKPNPFNSQTTIEYFIAGENSTGIIYVFDLQGKLIKSYNHLSQGHNQIIINANELYPGMYLYSLIIDGKEIETKRMILTD